MNYEELKQEFMEELDKSEAMMTAPTPEAREMMLKVIMRTWNIGVFTGVGQVMINLKDKRPIEGLRDTLEFYNAAKDDMP